jgi:sporulation protein YlmC with PRC-barrel domain
MYNMKSSRISNSIMSLGLATALSLGAATAFAQTSTSQNLSVNQQEMKAAERGWSAKKDIMNQSVYNDNNEKIGSVDDVIFSRGKSAETFAVIGVGGFLGAGTHDVAVPLNHLKHDGDKLVLSGATKDALKAMPEFQYSRNDRSGTRTSSRR